VSIVTVDQWDKLTKQFKPTQGALQGNIDQWIDILWEVSKVETEDGFLAALRRLLDAEKINFGPLVQAWNLACDVPIDARKDTFSVKQAMRHVNTFRNRFAHVPFPHDPLSKIAEALEQATEELFSVEPLPWKFPEGQPKSALMGGISYKGHMLRGGDMVPFSSDDPSSERQEFVHPGTKRGGMVVETWDASPFVHIDEMMRPYILTRSKDEITWEYTRFRAEANAVLSIDDKRRLFDLPRPEAQEYEIDEDKEAAAQNLESPPANGKAEVQRPEAKSFDEAIDALRSENYDRAIPFFEELTREKPGYHIAPLRLGVALREKANRLPDEKREEAIALLRQAIDALTRATGHRDPDYQGQAFYERSKAYFHLALYQGENEQARSEAAKDAVSACALSSESKFASWLEYLERRGFVAQPSTPQAPTA